MSATIHLSLNKLEPIHMSFRLTITPGQFESGSNGSIFLLEANGEIAEWNDAGVQTSL